MPDHPFIVEWFSPDHAMYIARRQFAEHDLSMLQDMDDDMRIAWLKAELNLTDRTAAQMNMLFKDYINA